MSSQSEFESRLISLLNNFLLYEDKGNQASALHLVPLDDLKAIAQAKYDSCEAPSENSDDAVKDLLLLELLEWFKEDFFKWIDTPECPNCLIPTVANGHSAPTQIEAQLSAGRVEVYRCPTCSILVRFPRYNNPVQLLKTRRGRCGEWANCFALICRAVGFEVRHISDWTDHVWVEIFSTSQRRWIHADPCENACDRPLLYEVGWGKKLTYCIAVSQDDIQDVTWRYSRDHKGLLSRRNLCDESWLISTILRLRKQRQSWIPDDRKKVLLDRLIVELVEFLSPNLAQLKDEEKVGRISGSLAWRVAREEVGFSEDTAGGPTGFIWRVNTEDFKIEEIEEDEEPSSGRTIELYYDSSADEYSYGRGKKKPGWKNGIYSSENILRKEEKDWKMVYLARTENSENGRISWRIENNVPSQEYTLNLIMVKVKMNIFHPSARARMLISSDKKNETIVAETNSDMTVTWVSPPDLRGAKWIQISCELGGGDGQSAWQHSQLFRQNLNSRGVGLDLNEIQRNAPFKVTMMYSPTNPES